MVGARSRACHVDEGVAVAGAREATRRYGLACAARGVRRGEDHLTSISGGDR